MKLFLYCLVCTTLLLLAKISFGKHHFTKLLFDNFFNNNILFSM